MRDDGARLGRTSAAFGMAAGITALFNTALACVNDAYRPLQNVMNTIAGHNWTTQGLADLILFVVLGLTLSRTRIVQTVKPDRVISFLFVAVAVAGVGLFAWYAVS
jgi:hypothetical protein